MAGPWEKYSQSSDDSDSGSDSAPAGPWSKYGGQSGSGDKSDFWTGTAKSTIDALPMIGGAVGGALGTPADALTGPAGTIGGAAIGGYLGTAAKNLINRYYDPKSAPQTAAQAITQPIMGGAEQGLMQGAGEAAMPALAKSFGATGDMTKWAATKALSNAGGVAPDVIKEYSQFSDRINSAKSVDQLKDISDKFIGKLADDVQTKELTADQAHEALKGFQSDLKDGYRSAGYDARDAVTSAQQSLKDAHNARIQNLSGDVYDSVNRLKSDVQAGSKKALAVLDISDATKNSAKGINPFVDLKPVHSQIDSTINKLKKAGTDESLAVAEKLQTYKTRLEGMAAADGTIPATDAKQLIQGLDQITEYSPMAGNFDKAKNAAFKDVRGALDESTKTAVPDYRKAMEPVAQDAALLKRVSGFGDKQSGAGLLGRINAPTQLENRAALQELGQKYGADYVKAAQPENLPEQQILNKAQAAQEALRPDRVAEKVEQTVAASRQKTALDTAQSGLDAAKEKLTPYKSLAPNSAGQTRAQELLNKLGKGEHIETETMFKELGKLTNTDFIQAMHDQGIQAAFQKGAYNGSRNAVRFGGVGGGIGYFLGGFSGAAGGMAGGKVLGGIVDQYGPAITKKIIDGAIQVSRSPTMATISRLGLPEPIKRNMIVGLENYLSHGSAGASVGESVLKNVAGSDKPSNQDRAPSGEDRWAQSGLKSLGLQDHPEAQSLLSNPKAKQLLIQASDLKPGSKAMQKINDQIQAVLKGAK